MPYVAFHTFPVPEFSSPAFSSLAFSAPPSIGLFCNIVALFSHGTGTGVKNNSRANSRVNVEQWVWFTSLHWLASLTDWRLCCVVSPQGHRACTSRETLDVHGHAGTVNSVPLLKVARDSGSVLTPVLTPVLNSATLLQNSPDLSDKLQRVLNAAAFMPLLMTWCNQMGLMDSVGLGSSVTE